jgi:hypothetical protein
MDINIFMNVLIAENQIHDHALYEQPRELLSSCTVSLEEQKDYLITDPVVLDFFLRSLYPICASKMQTTVIADARHNPNLCYSSKLMHFKLRHSEITVLGEEWNREFIQTTDLIRTQGRVPENIIAHGKARVTWPESGHVGDDSVVVVGCSYSAGAGLNNPQKESFSNIIFERTGRPVLNYGISGSSIEYASKVLRMLDIKKSNLVVWQLTGLLRWIAESYRPYPDFPVYVDRHEIAPHYLDQAELNKKWAHKGKNNLKCLVETRKYLQNIGCPFVLLGTDPFPLDLPWPEFIRVPAVDYGYDYAQINGKISFGHPGPLTHRAYADAVISKLGIR